MKKLFVFTSLIGLLSIQYAAAEISPDCESPEPPALPAAITSDEQAATLKTALNDYLASESAFITCLQTYYDEHETALSDGDIDALKALAADQSAKTARYAEEWNTLYSAYLK